MKKYLTGVTMVFLLFMSSIIYAEVNLKTIVLPKDGAKLPYTALVGYDEIEQKWSLLKLKFLENGKVTLDLGTLSTTGKIDVNFKTWQINSQSPITLLINGTSSITIPAGTYKRISILGDNYGWITITMPNGKQIYGRLSQALGWAYHFNFEDGLVSKGEIKIEIKNEIDRPQTFYFSQIYIP